MIKHWTEIKTGDRLFKDSDFDNKGKSLFMKFVTWGISIVQNLKSGDKEDGDDHSETFFWEDDILYVASATNKTGVRPIPFHRWAKQEGNPRVVLIRRRIPYTVKEQEAIIDMIKEDYGLPYALWPGAKALFGKPHTCIVDIKDELEERGMICSETTAKWDVDFYYWPNMLPQRLRELYMANDASEIFDGKVLNLFKL